MTCRKVSSYNERPGRGPFTSEADCASACAEGACCEGTTCTVKPQCQCQGAGKVFKGIGTTCSPNPCACPCVQTNIPANLVVEVTNTTRTLQYSLSQIAGSGNTIYGLGNIFYLQCMAWVFGSQQAIYSGTSDWITVRLLFKVSQGNEPTPTGADDYRAQMCRDGVSDCGCFLRVEVYQVLPSTIVYEAREPTLFALSSTASPASSLVGFTTSLSLFKLQVHANGLSDVLTTASVSVIGQE